VAAYVEMIKADPEHYQSELKALTTKSSANTMSVHAPLSDEGLDEQVHRFKVRVARETLTKCDGNVMQAARMLKISRPSLYRLIKERRAIT
jgi:DNA-binding NtrC family response regulator